MKNIKTKRTDKNRFNNAIIKLNIDFCATA